MEYAFDTLGAASLTIAGFLVAPALGFCILGACFLLASYRRVKGGKA